MSAAHLFEALLPLLEGHRVELCLCHDESPQTLPREDVHVLYRLLDDLTAPTSETRRWFGRVSVYRAGTNTRKEVLAADHYLKMTASSK